MDQVSEVECWLCVQLRLANETHGDAITFTSLDMDFAKANPSVDCIDSTEGGQGCTGKMDGVRTVLSRSGKSTTSKR